MSAGSDAIVERIAGIREDLPPGERVLWQGKPGWTSLALRAFRIREVAVYFALLAGGSAALARVDRAPLVGAIALTVLGLAACSLLALLAWLSSRTTVYAITTGRVFMRIGIALPIAINLPLRRIEAAQLAVHGDGTGDLPLLLEPQAHLAYLHLWPHARPWRYRRAEPMIRCVPAADNVARLLAGALAEAARSPRQDADPAPVQSPTSTAAASRALEPMPRHPGVSPELSTPDFEAAA